MTKPAFYRVITVFDDEETIESLSAKTSLAKSSLKKYLVSLEKDGIVEKTLNKYRLTEKGRALKETLQKIMSGYEAAPYVFTEPDTGTPIPLQVRNIKQLLVVLKYGLIDKKIAEEHFRRGYLVQWIRDGVGDKYLSMLISTGMVKNIDDLIAYLDKLVKIAGDTK